MSLNHLVFSLLLSSLLCACVSTQSVNSFETQALFQAGAFRETVNLLEMSNKRLDSDERLINYLNIAIVKQLMGECRESEGYFDKAERLIDKGAGSYQILAHESLMINFYRAINSICLSDIDGALVEMKKVDLKNHNQDIKKTYFSTYLSGLLNESQNKYDEAFIDYQRVYKVKKEFPYLLLDIYRTINLSGRSEDFKRFYDFKPKGLDNYILNSNLGEVVILFHSGIAPSLTFDVNRTPVFTGSGRATENIKLKVNGKNAGKAYELVDLVDLTTLNDQEYISKFRQSYFKTEMRNWSFLPEKIYIARIKAPEGIYKINLYNSSINKNLKVQIKKGTIHLVNLRDKR